MSKVRSMSFAQKEHALEEISKAQPNLLASVLCFHGRGVSAQNLEVVLHILVSGYEAVRASGLRIPMVSESVQELCLTRIVDRMRSADQLRDHAEINLLSLVLLQLQDHGLTKMASEADKRLVLCALNLVETIAYALNEV